MPDPDWVERFRRLAYHPRNPAQFVTPEADGEAACLVAPYEIRVRFSRPELKLLSDEHLRSIFRRRLLNSARLAMYAMAIELEWWGLSREELADLWRPPPRARAI